MTRSTNNYELDLADRLSGGGFSVGSFYSRRNRFANVGYKIYKNSRGK